MPSIRGVLAAVLLAGAVLPAAGCVFVPVGRPVVAEPAVVVPAPVIVAPAPRVHRGYWGGPRYYGGYGRYW